MASSTVKASPLANNMSKATFTATNKRLACFEEEMKAWRMVVDEWTKERAALLKERGVMRQEINDLKVEVASLRDRSPCEEIKIVEVKEAKKEEITKAIVETIEIKTKAMADSIEGKMDAKEGWVELVRKNFQKEAKEEAQKGFVQDRCILDNLFCLHQAMEWAGSSSTPLAILFLDFEKAYDRVDWGFLEGFLCRMGFPLAWIRGVSALYSGARINWDKSYGILAGSDDVSTWDPRGFTWLGPGATCRYGVLGGFGCFASGVVLSGHAVYEEEIMLLVISASFDGYSGFDSKPGDPCIGLVSHPNRRPPYGAYRQIPVESEYPSSTNRWRAEVPPWNARLNEMARPLASDLEPSAAGGMYIQNSQPLNMHRAPVLPNSRTLDGPMPRQRMDEDDFLYHREPATGLAGGHWHTANRGAGDGDRELAFNVVAVSNMGSIEQSTAPSRFQEARYGQLGGVAYNTRGVGAYPSRTPSGHEWGNNHESVRRVFATPYSAEVHHLHPLHRASSSHSYYDGHHLGARVPWL
ncbi:hypothetical protein L7F22_018723 [Adiantum nelumboides]|nr:hypothetical protein [Adiantum nelumboides]